MVVVSEGYEGLAEALVRQGAWIPSGVQGVYGRGENFVFATSALAAVIHRSFGSGAERMQFPPVMPRGDLERIGYFRNFPNLLGSVHCFCGDDRAHRDMLKRHDAGQDWTEQHRASDLVLTPAACYPVYPALAARGPVPAQGYLVEVQSTCFRREPSVDPMRLQSFDMHEIVRVGAAADVVAFRERLIAQGQAFFSQLGLNAVLSLANDPFFGRAGGVMGQGQRDKALKFELQVALDPEASPTACMSFNYHQDHFGGALGLRLDDGEIAHSACVGFGIDRIVLALFHQHGLSPRDWPIDVLELLAV
jgi:seryl-tRNA synthetase